MTGVQTCALPISGNHFLPEFTILSVVQNLEQSKKAAYDKADAEKNPLEAELQAEVVQKIRSMDKSLASECGFMSLDLLAASENDFYNGKPLVSSFFKNFDTSSAASEYVQAAVFTSAGVFAGIINYESHKFSYGYVVPRTDMM